MTERVIVPEEFWATAAGREIVATRQRELASRRAGATAALERLEQESAAHAVGLRRSRDEAMAAFHAAQTAVAAAERRVSAAGMALLIHSSETHARRAQLEATIRAATPEEAAKHG